MVIVAILLFITLMIILTPVWGWILAHFDICFTFIDEGECKAVMKGGKDLGGQLVNFIYCFEGWKMLKTKQQVDDYRARQLQLLANGVSCYRDKDYLENHLEQWELVPLEKNEYDQIVEMRRLNKFLNNWFGYRWFGLPGFNRIASWDFEWATVKIIGNATGAGQSAVTPRKERVSSIFLKQAPYYSEVLGKYTRAEENIPINLGYILGLSCRNPYKALFKQHRWLDGLTALTDQRAVSFILSKVFTELATNPGGTDDFHQYMEEIEREAMENFGHLIGYSKIFKKEPDGDVAKALVKATADIELAKRDGEAKVETAKRSATAEIERARGIKATQEAGIAGLAKELQVRASFVKKVGEHISDAPGALNALNAEVALRIAENPATKTLVIGGQGQGVTTAIAGIAEAIMEQVVQHRPAPAPVSQQAPAPATSQPPATT